MTEKKLDYSKMHPITAIVVYSVWEGLTDTNLIELAQTAEGSSAWDDTIVRAVAAWYPVEWIGGDELFELIEDMKT